MTGAVEEGHAQLFGDMLDRLESGGYESAREDIDWRCRNCGHVTTQHQMPGYCPLCGYDRRYMRREMCGN